MAMSHRQYYKQLESFGILKKSVKCHSCKHISNADKCKYCSKNYLGMYESNNKEYDK